MRGDPEARRDVADSVSVFVLVVKLESRANLKRE